MKRVTGGVVRVEAADFPDALRQLGVAHATDRPAQMALMRIIATGRATECLADDDELFAIDRYFRELGLYRDAAAQVATLEERERRALQAYCTGVNATLAGRARPMAFRVWGYRWESWTPEDIVTIARLMAWVGLAATQAGTESLLIELAQAGVADEQLHELFGPDLDGCDLDLVRSIVLVSRLTPSIHRAARAVGSLAGSNAWAVAPHKSRSGKTLLANDMHLEVNRLPAIWYEAILEWPGHTVVGTTVPGLPAVVTGRNRRLAWGVTYSAADTADYFVEDCRDGRYRRGDSWHEFTVVTETIRRRHHEAETVIVYTNDHGVLRGDPHQPGKVPCLAWTGWHGRAGEVVAAMHDLVVAQDVPTAMRAIRNMHYPSLNWVFADDAGAIGYQMSGLVPRRRPGWSGLYPVPGWDPENDWHGFVDRELFPQQLNPESGIVASANQDATEFGQLRVQSCPCNHHRYARIRQRLEAQPQLDVEDMKDIQLDILSLKAERWTPIFAAALPDESARQLLLDWDFRFHPDSRAASLFDTLYFSALREVFCHGPGSIPEAMFEHLHRESGLSICLDGCFERVLEMEAKSWFGARSRDAILQAAFADLDLERIERWGQTNRVTMENVFYGGKLPRFLGVDRGPVEMPGSSDTPRQGSVFRDAGRNTSYCPSNRFVTDLATTEAFTVIPGGPSEQRFSGRYTTDLEAWKTGEYKLLRL